MQREPTPETPVELKKEKPPPIKKPKRLSTPLLDDISPGIIDDYEKKLKKKLELYCRIEDFNT